MKLLIYGLNYAPELTGAGKYTAEMAEALAARGHEVRAVCAPPYYPAWRVADGWSAWRYATETRGGVSVRRAPLWVPAHPHGATRIVHLASFALTSIVPVLAQWRWRPDVVLAIAPTLVCAPAALALARATGARAWLHLQDFEVDAAFGLGLLRHAYAARLAHAYERAVLCRFDVVSSISERMVERLVSLGVAPARTLCLPNWVDVERIRPLGRASLYRKEWAIGSREKVVLYAGNMGAKQGLGFLLAAASRLLGRADIRFVLCGDGLLRDELARQCGGLPNCMMIGLQPAQRFNELLGVADVHVLPQLADAADLVMPSKLTGMMASGRAIVATAREGTQLAAVLSGRGVVVAPEDAAALAGAIETLADDPRLRARLGAAARRYAVRELSAGAVMERLEQRVLAQGSRGRLGPASEVAETAGRAHEVSEPRSGELT
ncbi:colanic acid biosynthesis glycosyltransferase WcaI [Trinickia dabaoshanensis]|uniref:Colanic acid biosynthesis glycosyltransferase WcaI n=1 Tax=Trinickia dabaoshanensis TaxID=564714 RepID=A0A2N7VH82_9BURK|nr:WcaI family glycosyltransferase [Trinickia dabaoshanensis]PMS16499.1 colanic acid biosynthesis glycosyltransferase WcaI [Trinickia dabaoshanensis]